MNEQEKQIASDLAQIWMNQGYYTGETRGLIQIGLFHALVAHRRAVMEECKALLQARKDGWVSVEDQEDDDGRYRRSIEHD